MPNTNQASLTPGSKCDPMELVPDPEPRRDGRRMSRSTIPDGFRPIVENGRQYQGYRPGGARIPPHFLPRTSNADRIHPDYSLPMDVEEQDRLDMTHHGYKILMDGNLFIAPFEEAPSHVLDIGTGMRAERHALCLSWVLQV